MSKKSNKHPTPPLSPLHHLEFILQHQSDQLLRAGLGVGFSQIRIMDSIGDSTVQSQRELAKKLYQTEANISRQLKVLHQQGLVEVVKIEKDKRQRHVKLTPKGTDCLSKAHEVLTNQHKKLLASLEFREAYNFTETANKLLASL